MKNLMMMAIVAVVGLVCGVALHGEEPAVFKYAGTIAKVDGAKVILTMGRAPLQTYQATLMTDSKTEVTLDDKAAKLTDLLEGQAAVVTYIRGAAKQGEEPPLTATRIEATSGK
jgi:hypothetical protein